MMFASAIKRGLFGACKISPVHRRMLSKEVVQSLEFLKVEEAQPFVYLVQLNRPEKMNAMNMKLWEEIGLTFRELGKDPDCRSVVLSAQGKIFTAGIDLNELASIGAVVQGDDDIAKKGHNLYRTITKLQELFSDIERCPKPVIAAVHSACVGGGVDLITATDVRLCTKDAWFQVKEVEMGLAADVGTLQRLPKVVSNQSLVRELCFTARKFDSKEAENMGLVSSVYEDKESMMKAALAMAGKIANLSPVAVQGTKINLNYSRDHSVPEGLDYVARWNMGMLQSADIMKAVTAAMTKEKPEFSKL